MSGQKRPRRVLPREWAALDGYAKALRKYGETGDARVFDGVLIRHEDMADALRDVAYGVDARVVFQQVGTSGRQALGPFHFTLAYCYWRARASGRTHREALDVAEKHFSNFAIPAGDSLARIARTHREWVFRLLESGGTDLAELRAQLKRRARHGQWGT